MTQTLELPREDLKWELENRLGEYVSTGAIELNDASSHNSGLMI